MDFLNPVFAWGAFALAIPLIVHFIHRKRYRILDFPAIRFILESHQRKQRSVRLSQLLLLLIRTLLVAALVLAFSRPALKLPGSMMAGKARRAVALIIDDTASTATISGVAEGSASPSAEGSESGSDAKAAASSFRRSVESAGSLVASLASEDRVAVMKVSSAGTAEPVFVSPGRAAETLETLESTASGGNAAEVLKRAAEALRKRDEPDRAAMLFTDLQEEILPEGFEIPGVPLKVVDTSGRPDGPVPVITGVELSSDMVAPGMAVTVRVLLRNCGFTPTGPRKVRLFTESGRLETPVGAMQASGTGEAVFTVSFPRPGLFGCRAEIDGNENPHGAKFHFPVEVRSRIFVLLVNGTQARLETAAATFFAALALNPSGEAGGGLGMAPVVCQVPELPRHDLRNYDVVVLANVPGFDEASGKALDEFVRSGGGLMVLCGEAMDPEAMGRSYGGLVPGRPLKRVEAPPGGAGLFRLTSPKLDHPVMSPFRGDGSEALGQPGFKAAISLSINELDPGVSVLARLNDEIPAIVEGRIGIGRTIFFASSMDSTWDTLVAEPAFVPLLHQMVRRLAARGTVASGLVGCGEAFDVRLPLSAGKSVVNVVDPSGRRVGLKTEPTTNFLVARFAGTTEAGVYTVETDDGVKAGKSIFAANPPASEWELGKSGTSRVAGASFSTAAPAASSFSYELWKLLLWAMTILGLAELMIANRMAAPDSDSGGDSGTQGRRLPGSPPAVITPAILVPAAAIAGLTRIFGTPAMAAEEVLARSLELGNPSDFWTWGLVAAAAYLAVTSYRRVRDRAGISNGPLLLGLRLLGLAIVLAMLLKPVMIMDLQVTTPGVTAVIIDASDSMSIVDSPTSGTSGPGRSRAEAVRAELGASGFFDVLASKGEVETFSFSSETARSNPSSFSPDSGGVRVQGGHTDMGGALIGVRQMMKERRLTSMVLVGDGRNTFGQDPTLMARLAGVPVHTLGVGSMEALRDAAIEGLTVKDTAFVDAPLKVGFRVSSRGYDGVRTAVTLTGEGGELARKFVTLGPSPVSETLVFTPDAPGLYTMELNIAALPGEVVLANNTRRIIVNVVESRVRALLVGERPSWDYKFLKSTLEEDDSVLLASLCLDRGGKPFGTGHGASSAQTGSNPPASPRPGASDGGATPPDGNGRNGKRPNPPVSWPVKDLSALAPFDVIILCDPVIDREDCRVLAEAVGNGTGLWLAGDLSGVVGKNTGKGEEGAGKGAGQGAGQGAGIIPGLSPITLDPRAMRPNSFGELTLSLADAGMDHPVTKLAPGRSANSSAWGEWPTIPGAFVGKPKAGAAVLAMASSRAAGQIPVLCAQRYGKGKVISFTAMGIWKLRFMMAGVGKGAGHFRRLVTNSVRWLKPRPDDSLLNIETDKRHYLLGERVHLSATLLDDNFVPLSGASITLRFEDRISRGGANDGKGSEIVLSDSGGGSYTGSFAPRATGEFEVLATAGGAGPVRTAATRILVMTPPEEFLEVARDQAMLERISTISGGINLDLGQAAELAARVEAPVASYESRREVALWNTWHAFLAFISVLTLEWILRKREGLE